LPLFEHSFPSFEKFIEDVKIHVKKHQTLYSIGAGSALTAAGFVLMSRSVGSIQIAPVFNNVNQQVNFGGHTSKIVKCIETNKIWEQVTDAAKDNNASLSLMSRHLNGHKPDVYGKHYKIIGLSTSA
jgi:hypothetical protein